MPKLCIYLTPCSSMLEYERTVDRLSGSASGRNFEYNVCGINSSTNDKPVKSGKTSNKDIIWKIQITFNCCFSELSPSQTALNDEDDSRMDNRNSAMFLFRAMYSMRFHHVSCGATPFLSPLFAVWTNLAPSIRPHEHLRQFSATLYTDWLCIPPFRRFSIENLLPRHLFSEFFF